MQIVKYRHHERKKKIQDQKKAPVKIISELYLIAFFFALFLPTALFPFFLSFSFIPVDFRNSTNLNLILELVTVMVAFLFLFFFRFFFGVEARTSFNEQTHTHTLTRTHTHTHGTFQAKSVLHSVQQALVYKRINLEGYGKS